MTAPYAEPNTLPLRWDDDWKAWRENYARVTDEFNRGAIGEPTLRILLSGMGFKGVGLDQEFEHIKAMKGK